MSAGLRKELIRLLGLHSNANQYLAPDGALRTATNVWLQRPGLIQKRRGFSRWSTTLTLAINKLFPYEGGEMVAHCGSGGSTTLVRVSTGGAPTTYASGFNAPDESSGWKVRGCIAGKDFLFNTSQDVYRLSGINGTPVKAGGLVATNITLALTGASGFLPDVKSCAYRYCIGSTNNFGKDIIGPVSGRALIANAAGGSRNVNVTVGIPSTATEDHFIQVYRSENVANGSQPDDDLQLVYEAQLKAAEIAAGSVTFTDVVTEALRGGFIYTAPNAGQGILQNNEPPPYCKEIVFHKERVWYANTVRRGEFLLSILAVGGTDGIQNGDVLKINGGAVTLTANTGAAGANEYHVETGGTAAYNIEQTALNLVAAINAPGTTNSIVWARYVSGPNEVPGRILIFNRVPDGLTFNVFVGAGSKRDCWSPSLLPAPHTMDLSRAASATVTATVTSGTQNFKVGEKITVQGGNGTGSTVFGNGPFTILTIDTVGPSTFITYSDTTETTHTGTLAARSVSIYSDDIAQFELEVRENRIYYSKQDEFEAVPILNYLDVGRQDQPIIACVSADDQLWVWKRDGVFRISGDDETNFRVVDVDLTVRCVARETVVKFQGKAVGLTNKGMMRASVSGLEPMDWQIQKDILDRFTDSNSALLEKLAFAVPYDSEDLLLVFFGDNRDFDDGVTTTQCNTGYVYCARAEEWTLWKWDTAADELTFGHGKLCGVVNPSNDKLYFGDRYSLSTSKAYIYQENKARTAADFRDQLGDGNYQAITSLVSPVLQTARAPGMEKFWQEVAILFNGTQPSSFNVGDGNEWTNGGTHTIVPGAGYVARLWPFPDASRGSFLTLDMSHAISQEAFELAGIQVYYELLGPEVTR